MLVHLTPAVELLMQGSEWIESLCYVQRGRSREPVAAAPAPGASPARVPSGLHAAIDRTLAAEPVTSPAGVTLSWCRDGAVSFRLAKGISASFTIRPESVGRARPLAPSPGPFVFGPTKTAEALGEGVTDWYKTSAGGFEQGFTLARRPTGAANSFRIVIGYSGRLHPRPTSPGSLSLSGPAGSAMTYGGLRVTDARGKKLPAHLAFGDGQVRMTMDDAGAVYPVNIEWS